jgi:predicted Zn-dependent protease
VDSTAGKNALAGWYLQRGRTADARAVWEGRLAERPGDLYARYQLARISALRGGELDEAVGHLQAYLAATPRPGWPPRAAAQWRLGQVYEKQGMKPEAIAAYEESLRLDPRNEQAKQDLARVRKKK